MPGPSTPPRPLPGRVPALGVLLAALLTLARTDAAGATTYHVRPTGNDAASGLSSSAAWATIGKANATVRPGDVVIVWPGTYAQFPSPAVSGTSLQRITFAGALASPSSVVLNAADPVLAASHVTVKGFLLANGFLLTGSRDSIADCVIGGGKSQLTAANDCVITRCAFDCERFWIVGTENDSLPIAARDTVTDCRLTLRPRDTTGHTIRFAHLEQCVVTRCRFTIDIGSSAVSASCTKLFFVRHSRFVDNWWDITNHCTTNSDEAGWFVMRDYTQSNTWVRDTIQMRGPGPVQFFGSASGTYPATVMNNNYDHCVIKVSGPSAYGAAVYYQDEARWDTLTANVIVGDASGLAFNAPLRGPMRIAGNTIAGFDPAWGAIGLDDSQPWSGSIQVRDNILYTASGATRRAQSAPMVFHLDAVTGHIAGNRNVLFGPMRRDSAITAWPAGLSPPGVGGLWCVNTRADSNSVWGSPRFADTSSVASFDGHLLAGSAAIGAATGGADAGALSSAVSSPDVLAPAAVSDLQSAQVADHSLLLTWTAPGDDAMSGTAAAYDLRWSLSPISAGTFAQATPVTPQPIPAPAGSAQSYVLLGLSSGSTYHLAIRTRDEAGNWSAVSNLVDATTLSVDTLAPASIGTLAGTR